MRNEVASWLMGGAFAPVAVLALAFEPARSWRSVGVQLAVLYSVQVISGAALLYWVRENISMEHVDFLIKKSPFIIAKYLYRLPWGGWGQLTEFAELLVLAYKHSKGMSLEDDEPAPTTMLGHSGGQASAKMTASI